MAKIAKLAPAAQRFRTEEEMQRELAGLLKAQFCLEMLPRFSVLVEGWTDVHYINHAVKLHEQAYGSDLLEIPSAIAEFDGERIGVFTPGSPGDHIRGGVKQMVRLAIELKPYVFTLRGFQGLAFVFDHDDAGLEAKDKVLSEGYRDKSQVLTLDPKEHPLSCATKQVCIEDLLALKIQQQYFESTPSTCSIDYLKGKPLRIHWGHEAKPGLRDFILQNARLDDVSEIVVLLHRVRRALELPN